MNRKLHVAQILPSFEWGGTQSLVVLLAAQARRLDVEITVISFGPDMQTPYARQLRDFGASVVFLEGRHALDPVRLIRLARLIRREKIDLIHAHLTKPNTAAPIAGWLARRPVIAGLHTLPSKTNLRSRLRTKCEAFAVRRAACAISCATSIAVQEKTRLAPVSIKVVSNPALSLPSLRNKPRQEGALRFISVGRLSPVKGFDVMLIAAALLKQKEYSFTIQIIGDGELRAALQEQIASADLQDRVFMEGPREDIPELLAKADVFLSASRFEGLSMAMLEAMGQGLAVVATDVGDTAKILTPDVGVLVAPGSAVSLAAAMQYFIEAPHFAVSCGAAAHRLVKETRSPRKWASQYIKIYRETVSAYHQRTV